jgi:hypothetical protein
MFFPGPELFPSRIQGQKDFRIKYLSILTRKIVSKLSKYDPDLNFLPIPHPGSRGQKGPRVPDPAFLGWMDLKLVLWKESPPLKVLSDGSDRPKYTNPFSGALCRQRETQKLDIFEKTCFTLSKILFNNYFLQNRFFKVTIAKFFNF